MIEVECDNCGCIDEYEHGGTYPCSNCGAWVVVPRHPQEPEDA